MQEAQDLSRQVDDLIAKSKNFTSNFNFNQTNSSTGQHHNPQQTIQMNSAYNVSTSIPHQNITNPANSIPQNSHQNFLAEQTHQNVGSNYQSQQNWLQPPSYMLNTKSNYQDSQPEHQYNPEHKYNPSQDRAQFSPSQKSNKSNLNLSPSQYSNTNKPKLINFILSPKSERHDASLNNQKAIQDYQRDTQGSKFPINNENEQIDANYGESLGNYNFTKKGIMKNSNYSHRQNDMMMKNSGRSYNIHDSQKQPIDKEREKVELNTIFNQINDYSRKIMVEKNNANSLNLVCKKEVDDLIRLKKEFEKKIHHGNSEVEQLDEKCQELEKDADTKEEQKQALIKENKFLQNKIFKLGDLTRDKVQELSVNIEGYHYEVEHQRENFFVNKNKVDSECQIIFQEMEEDYKKNDCHLKQNIKLIDGEVEIVKADVNKIKDDFELLRVELIERLKEAEDWARKDQYEQHEQKTFKLEGEYTEVISNIKEIDATCKVIEQNLEKEKLINKKELMTQTSENRNQKGALDVLINSFKNTENQINISTEKYQTSRNELIKSEDVQHSVKNVGEQRQLEYDHQVQSVINENELDIREHELKIQEYDAAGDEILQKFDEIIKKAKIIKDKRDNLFLDVESGLSLTLHNCVHDY